MLWFELLMLGITAMVCFFASVTDCREGVIKNKLLIIGAVVLGICDILYYITFGREFFLLFLTNFIGMAAIGMIFYGLDIWAAGDSKFIIVVSLGIPAGIWSHRNLGPLPGFGIVVITFAVAFLYLLVDSILQYRKRRRMGKHILFPGNIDGIRILVSYFFMVGCIQLLNDGFTRLGGEYLGRNAFLITALDFLAILLLIRVRNLMHTRMLLTIATGLWAFNLFLQGQEAFPHINGNWKFWVLVLLVIMFRLFANQFNYEEIPTSKVRSRMILSAHTIMLFRKSRVKGLPYGMTEDLRSRITEAEAEAVRRWETSKYGKEGVEIVRKIPFAIFISLGSALMVLLEVVAK